MVETTVDNIIDNQAVCKRCHRKLKDKQSKELGFGKVCYQKYLRRKRSYLFEMEVTNETTT